jgi:myosin-5
MIRLQELEMENAKIKDDLKNLRRQAATENEVQLPRMLDMLMSQFNAMSDELDRRREECIQLRTLLANTTLGGDIGEQTTLNASLLNGGEPFAEDNEILMAFESQKRIIRHLENELQEEKASSQRKIQIEREEVERLRLDNEQQAKLLAGALHRKKKLKQEGVHAENQEASPEVHETVYSSRRNERSESLPVVRKKETNYLGMFDFNIDDARQIVRNLVYGESFWCCDE